MTKELAAMLNQRMGGLYFVDVQAGLVQTIEYAAEGEGGRTIIERFPAAWDFLKAPIGFTCNIPGSGNDLTPNSRLRGVSYFEDFGTTTQETARGYVGCTTRLRFVCWMNRAKITGEESPIITQRMVMDVVKKITGWNPFNFGNFTRVQVKVLGVPPLDKSIFSRYTYSEAVRQYMMPPFEAFAIDLQVGYRMISVCHVPIDNADFECK